MTRGWLLGLAGIAAAVLAAAVLWLVPFNWQDDRVQQASIAGLVISVGWFMGFFLREISQLMGRWERVRDVHRALYAEIGHNLYNLGEGDALETQRVDMLDRIQSGQGFVPLIPRERNDTVFRSIAEEIHILPRTSVDPVVAYYSQLAAIDAMVEDMRGETFKTISEERRAAMYGDYIDLKQQAKGYGDFALEMIDAYAEGGRRKAMALREERRAEVVAASGLNSPDGDRSGQ